MSLRALFMLLTMCWSAVAGATGGFLYTCNMKGGATMTRCCCPTKKAKAAGQTERIERICCEATQIAAAEAPARVDEQRRAPTLSLAALPVSISIEPVLSDDQIDEVIARATAPPADDDLYLEIRTLLL